MRLRTPLSFCLAAAAVLFPGADPSAAARTSADPSCGGADDPAFPVTTRIHGGPASYEAGGGFGVWYVDLTNTTSRTCAGLHPVVVLVDDKRALQASQPQLDFYDGSLARPVRFESTDRNELVGVLDGTGFAGFSVAPGKTVTVKVRLSLTSDAVANEVTANAAVVQRHNDDGDWIGQSNDYRFGIAGEGGDGGDLPRPSAAPKATPSTPATPGAPSGAPSISASASGSASPGTGLPSAGATRDPDGDVFEAGDRDAPAFGELAGTGLGSAPVIIAAVTLLALVGAGVFLLARARRCR
ncbi:hypothetical protein [Streptomyces sp. NPDC086787]|uniref:hypothetical protein n=1 Tax=Streptomyces sp. NPDC086787 TaxID=3365759 RepID=UPI0037FF397E